MNIYINQETKEQFFAHEFHELEGHVKIVDEVVKTQGIVYYFIETDTEAAGKQKTILRRERWQKPKTLKPKKEDL